jgi:alkanesulfonate monooxygenase SsuD/methylene tetrahydromethanopterin reductase-like flavin-dependent oxidoreductase (luciferase family)
VRVRLGVHYDPARVAATSDDAARLHREILEHAMTAEALGVDVAWVAERPTDPRSVLPAALLVCAAIAARTRRLRVATALLPLPLHHPLRVAEDAATLDGISNGRFELGVGLGSDPEGLPGYGIATGERAERFEEAVALIRQAWQDGPVRFEGRHFRCSDVEVTPKPVQRPGPPIWVGAGIPAAQQRAARLGAGLLAAPGVSPEPYLKHWRQLQRDPDAAHVAAFLSYPSGAEPLSQAEGVARSLRAGAGQLDLILPAVVPRGVFAALRSRWPRP